MKMIDRISDLITEFQKQTEIKERTPKEAAQMLSEFTFNIGVASYNMAVMDCLEATPGQVTAVNKIRIRNLLIK